MLSCPLSFEKTEFYLQILLPAYKFILGFQRTKSSIAEVIPGLLVLFNCWNNLAKNNKFKPICLKLIKCFEQKFDYELNSNIYIASAMLNVSKLKTWYWRSFSGEHFENIINKSKTALFDATTVLIDKNKSILSNSNTNNNSKEKLLKVNIKCLEKATKEKYYYCMVLQELERHQ